jgi:phosphosulfolactate phosphohydrolase-like enzyme
LFAAGELPRYRAVVAKSAPAHGQGSYEVRMDWGPSGASAVTPDCAVVVVVDVLSFSTTLSVAMERGLRVWLELSPEAAVAAASYRAVADDVGVNIRACASGRELIDSGYPEDLRIAAELDLSDAVPVLRDGAFIRA